MAQEEGLVESTSEDGWARVVTARRDACADCAASHCCVILGGGSKMVINALNRAGAGVGDFVSIGLRSATVIQSAAILYMIPVLGLITGAVVGTTLDRGLPLKGEASAILFSFVGLALGFLITALLSKRLSGKKQFTPVIDRILKAGEQGPESLINID